jgi:two-component system nitrogen regulation response regulator NtrX
VIAGRAIETLRLRREVNALKQLNPQAQKLIGQSAPMNGLRQTIERIAPTNSRILIVGPSGSGKELTARIIHNSSAR